MTINNIQTIGKIIKRKIITWSSIKKYFHLWNLKTWLQYSWSTLATKTRPQEGEKENSRHKRTPRNFTKLFPQGFQPISSLFSQQNTNPFLLLLSALKMKKKINQLSVHSFFRISLPPLIEEPNPVALVSPSFCSFSLFFEANCVQPLPHALRGLL